MSKCYYIRYLLIVLSFLNLLSCSEDSLELLSEGAQESAVWRNPEVMTRSQAQKYFLRDHAVGYSYNAVSGSSYSLDDVRCQIINRAELDRLADVSDYFLYFANVEQSQSTEGNVYHSFTEYQQKTYLTATEEAEICLINGGKANAYCSLFEDGTEDCLIVESHKKITNGEYNLQPDAIANLAKKHPSVLTASFRDAVNQVAKASNENFVVCVDSFINTYGTHVVTYAEMGASLDVLVQVNTKKFTTAERTYTQMKYDVLNGLIEGQSVSSGDSVYTGYLRDSKCNINVVGGDVSLLDKLANMNYYGLGTVDTSVFGEWQNSVVFDPNDFDKSTASVIKMNFTPIYKFINDPIAKKRVSSVIKGSMQNMIELLGNRNFVNVSFPYSPQTLSYTIGNKESKECYDPDVTNVVYGGRHVATVCVERIESIDAEQDVRVVYPIYEGRVQLYNGICLHKGRAYEVSWDGDNCMVKSLGDVANGNRVYITAGAPSFSSYSNISYHNAHLVPDIEIDTPFNTDGSYNKSAAAYFVRKNKGSFFLPDTKGNSSITGIPNYSFDNSSNMMKRDSKYVYIYNPNELKYND